MKTLQRIVPLGILVAAGTVSVASPALADVVTVNGFHYSTATWSGSEGNTDIGNRHIYFNQETASWLQRALLNQPGFSNTASATSAQMFIDAVYLFGREFDPITLSSTGQGNMSATFAYTKQASADFWVLNQKVASGTPTTCNGNRTCATVNQNISKTLFSTSGSVPVGFVPVTVTASVQGGLRAGAHGEGFASPFSTPGTFSGKSEAHLNAGAFVSASLSAQAGIPDVLAVGVTASFKLIDIGVTPMCDNVLLTTERFAEVVWNNGVPIRISTMGGSVDVWAQITPFFRPSTTLVSWNGLSFSQQFFNSTGDVTF